MAKRRWFRFYAVGAAGMVVQTGVFAALAPLLYPHYLVATGIAVEMAVLHNFLWHRRWTWADRREVRVVRQMVEFNLTTGLMSLVANLVLMRVLVGLVHLRPLVANLLAIACCSVVTFVISDRVVFARWQTLRGRSRLSASVRPAS